MTNFKDTDTDPDVAVFRTDNRDLPIEDQYALSISIGGNGDWYVATHPVGEVTLNSVRICTSGGAVTNCPRLGIAIADAFTAIKQAESGIKSKDLPPTYKELEDEVNAWRSKFKDMEFDGVYSIRTKPESLD